MPLRNTDKCLPARSGLSDSSKRCGFVDRSLPFPCFASPFPGRFRPAGPGTRIACANPSSHPFGPTKETFYAPQTLSRLASLHPS